MGGLVVGELTDLGAVGSRLFRHGHPAGAAADNGKVVVVRRTAVCNWGGGGGNKKIKIKNEFPTEV